MNSVIDKSPFPYPPHEGVYIMVWLKPIQLFCYTNMNCVKQALFWYYQTMVYPRDAGTRMSKF